MVLGKLMFSGPAKSAGNPSSGTRSQSRDGSPESDISSLKSNIQELARSQPKNKPSTGGTDISPLEPGLLLSLIPLNLQCSLIHTIPQSFGIMQSIEKDTDTVSDGEDDKMETMETGLTPTDGEKADGAVILDPKNSTRQYWVDPATNIKREIWRPGDGDGDKAADFFGKPGVVPPLERRWRVYQSNTGIGPIEYNINEPPKYVILDDRSAYECFASKIPRQYLKSWWSHDFGGSNIVRSRREHRGRGSIADKDAEGDDKYNFARIGKTGADRYYFTGEGVYTPIVYRSSDPELAIAAFKPAKRGLPSPPPRKELAPNKHGHNQFTPKDQMVKHGAAPKGVSHLRYKPRLNTFLTRDKSPRQIRRFGTMAEGFREDEKPHSSNADAHDGTADGNEEDAEMFMENQTPFPPSKKLKTSSGRAVSLVEMGSEDDEDEEDEVEVDVAESDLAKLEVELATAKRMNELQQARISRLESLKERADRFQSEEA